jgi:hypothetical protein
MCARTSEGGWLSTRKARQDSVYFRKLLGVDGARRGLVLQMRHSMCRKVGSYCTVRPQGRDARQTKHMRSDFDGEPRCTGCTRLIEELGNTRAPPHGPGLAAGFICGSCWAASCECGYVLDTPAHASGRDRNHRLHVPRPLLPPSP